MDNKRITTIETKRLILKPLGLDFLSKTYLDWMQDTQVVIHMESGGADYTFEMLEEYLTKRCIKYTKNVNNNTTVIRWVKNNIIPIKYSDLYDENQGKIYY